jgi:hypothetical protein
VRCTITPFLQATCPSRSSGQNWLCLALSCPGGVSRPPSPLAGHPGQIGFVWRICPSSPVPLASSLPAPPGNWLCFAPRRQARKEIQTRRARFPWRSLRLCARYDPSSPECCHPRLRPGVANWVCLAPYAAAPARLVTCPSRVPRGHWGKLALFFRSLSNVLFTITPFPPSLCSSFCSAGNWLCLAPACPGGLSRPPGPNWVRLAHFAVVYALWPRPSRPAPPGIGFVFRSGASRRCRTIGSSRDPACPECESGLFPEAGHRDDVAHSAFKSQIIIHTS